MKVKFFDKQILCSFYKVLCVILTIISLIFLFLDLHDYCKYIAGILLLIFCVLVYLYIWRNANSLTKISLIVNNSNVDILVGNIFEDNGIKVIAFNEYFDSKVDEKVISSRSLNGQFLTNSCSSIQEFDDGIEKDPHLTKRIIEKPLRRNSGKQIKYKLGTIFEYKDFFLVAFSHFDADNRAFLTMTDLVSCLIEFWNEVDKFYASRTVSIPLLGSGITRLKEAGDVNEQELLEILLWTFKISRIRFRYPSKIKIIISNDKIDKINLFEIKHKFNQ